MIKIMLMSGLCGLLVCGSSASAQVTAMDNNEMAATVLPGQQVLVQPTAPVDSGSGQIAGVAAEALTTRATPVVATPSADISTAVSGTGNQRQISIQLPITPNVNDQLSNMAMRNIVISQGNLR